MKEFTVILIYPDYACDTFGDTWCGPVEAINPADAAVVAQKLCAADNPNQEVKPEDFGVVAVFEGRQRDLFDHS